MSDSITINISELSSEQVAQLLETARQMRSSLPVGVSTEIAEWKDALSTGWTLDHVLILRDRLRARGNDVQLAAFNQAIKNGGSISREEIFRLGNYDPDRQLKNWTKPLRTITTELIETYGLPKDAELPMEADYTEGTSFRQAHMFSVTPEIVKLAKEAMCDDCWHLKDIGRRGRVVHPHANLERAGEFRQIGNGSLQADEQDYQCNACGKLWMHETGNAGMGWIETGPDA